MEISMAAKQSDTGSNNNQKNEPNYPRLVCLETDQIRLYDSNPRTTRNPVYDEIKLSILNQGLEQPLIVTRRPGEATYIVKAGGNTRLQILKELYAASADPSFAMVNCIEVDWQDESDVLLGHLRENSLRGDLCFVDKAAAVCAYTQLLAEEQGGIQPTIREIQDALNDRGYPVSSGLLSYMRYTTEFLLSAMPVALSDGLGRCAVEKIRRLHSYAGRVWVQCNVGSADEFDTIFAELCHRHDGPDWQPEPLRRAVEIEIAEAADISIQTVSMAIDATQFVCQPLPEMDLTEVARKSNDDDPILSDIGTRRAANDTRYDPPEPAALGVSVAFVDGADDQQQTDEPAPMTTVLPTFVELRRTAYAVADGLSNRYGLSDLILPLPDCGNGFLVADLPPASLLEHADPMSCAVLSTLWWQLMAFSETACAPPDVITDRLPESSDLRTIIEQALLELLFDRVRVIDAAHLADHFWSQLPEQDWHDWLSLANTHRQIRAKVIVSEQPLWSRAL